MLSIIDVIKMKKKLNVREPATEETINTAEKRLSLLFCDEYRTYLSTFGQASYFCHELTGLRAPLRLDVTVVTQYERMNNTSIPSDWYVVEQTNMDGIVIWQDTAGAIYQTSPDTEPRRICESLCEYVAE